MKAKVMTLIAIGTLVAVAMVVSGGGDRPAAHNESPAFSAALDVAVRQLEGVTSKLGTVAPAAAAGVVQESTVDPGGLTCDATPTCYVFPTFTPLTCDSFDPLCNSWTQASDGFTCDAADPLCLSETLFPVMCDTMPITFDASPTCHVKGKECVAPTAQFRFTCDSRETCDGNAPTCDGTWTHWNTTCDVQGQTCDASPTCNTPGAEPVWTCGHFTVDGSATCTGVPTCHTTCEGWFTCAGSGPDCVSETQKTTWGRLKSEFKQ